MDLRFAIAFLLLAQLSFAECIGYTESFDVRALDAKGRALPGAIVTVTFDRGASFGEQYFTTAPQTTNESGRLHFDIYNQGTTTRTIDCDIEVQGTAFGSATSTTIEAEAHGNPVDLKFSDIYPVRFYVRDQLGAALKNATIEVDGTIRQTNEKGYADYYLTSGFHDYLASYLDGSQAGSLEIRDDSDFEVRLRFYKVSVRAYDDQGAPVDAALSIGGKEVRTQGGIYSDEKAFGEEIDYVATYMGVQKSGTMYPAVEPDLELVFDLGAPAFDSITPESSESGKPRLIIQASDPGSKASGVDPKSIKVTYRVEPSEPGASWLHATTFTTGRDSFSAEFPEIEENRLVSFNVEIRDKEGNVASVDGKFTSPAKTPPETGNQTEDHPETQDEGENEQGIPLLYIVGGVIVIILAIYLLFRLKGTDNTGA